MRGKAKRALLGAAIAGCWVAVAGAAGAATPAPGAPGAKATFLHADKHGFGTSHSRASHVWYTLRSSQMSEVYYPDLGTPATRSLELVVSDGEHVEREAAASGTVRLLDGRGLSYRQTTTSRTGAWKLTKTYMTDPARATVLVDVRLDSLTGKRLRAWVVLDPQLSNDGSDDRSVPHGEKLIARDADAASVLTAVPSLRGATSGYRGTSSDPLRDLRKDGKLDRRYVADRPGNVVQAAGTRLTGLPRGKTVRLALSFGSTPERASAAARASLLRSATELTTAFAGGWNRYLRSLKPPPVGVDRRLYDASVMLLAAHEDKLHPGASVASPSMPWAWGDLSVEKPRTGPYHLVWARDLYQVATAQLAAGDRAAAVRMLRFLFDKQQKPDGSFPQNSEVDGTEHWKKLQMDQVGLPIVLAWQLDLADAATWKHVRAAADFIMKKGPITEQERWENQAGYAPGTIAAQIAGLVCAADLARRNGEPELAARYEARADEWTGAVESWTATTNGPLSASPYYLRLSKHRDPNVGTTYNIGDSGPSKADQRGIVDPSFLELVRLGVKKPDDPVVVNTLEVVDRVLGVDTPAGRLWRRFTGDGYGETATGGPWKIGKPDTFKTFGRAWPIFAGERGEYELLAGRQASAQLAAMAGAANDGQIIAEQVWDGAAPTGKPGFPAGEQTFAASPLAWSHAQYVRLAWSIDAGRPVEQPAIVACRYTGRCT